jgi:hypothetical protein
VASAVQREVPQRREPRLSSSASSRQAIRRDSRLGHLVRRHSHEAADKVDAAIEASAENLRALWISLEALPGQI